MSASELVSEFRALTLQHWMGVSMDALAIFEYVATFDQEVLFVWNRKPTGASVLLFAVRYTMLLSAIMDISMYGPLESKNCTETFLIVDAVLLLLGFIFTAVFSALRVYALCGRNIRLSTVVFVLQLSPVAVNLYNVTQSTFVLDPLFGCVETSSFGLKTQETLTYIARIPLIVGDAMVVFITWAKSFQQLNMQRNLAVPASLSTLLFRDGTAYFLILLVMSVLETCPLTSTLAGLIVGTLSGALPLILINRFILNLRQSSQSSNPDTRSAGVGTVSTVMFGVDVDVAGNMGESLQYGWEPRDMGELQSEASPCSVEEAEFLEDQSP